MKILIGGGIFFGDWSCIITVLSFIYWFFLWETVILILSIYTTLYSLGVKYVFYSYSFVRKGSFLLIVQKCDWEREILDHSSSSSKVSIRSCHPCSWLLWEKEGGRQSTEKTPFLTFICANPGESMHSFILKVTLWAKGMCAQFKCKPVWKGTEQVLFLLCPVSSPTHGRAFSPEHLPGFLFCLIRSTTACKYKYIFFLFPLIFL